jgi:very-short-patch-repair endonuclease
MLPKPLSVGEEEFALQCKAYGFKPEREYEFVPGRKFRFDFAFPEPMIAFEIEGGTTTGKSRHSKGEGFERDCRKYNLAAALGWRVYRFTTQMVKRGEAIDALKMAIFPEDL